MFMLWHNCLGHLGSTMMRRIIENSHKHPLNIRLSHPLLRLIVNFHCFCKEFKKKYIDQSTPYWTISLLCDFDDASTWWSHVCLVSTSNVAFARLLARIIRLRAQFLNYPIKTTCLNNTDEFISKTFDDYWTSTLSIQLHI